MLIFITSIKGIVCSQSLVRFNRTYPYVNKCIDRGASSLLLKDSFVYTLGWGAGINKSDAMYFTKHQSNGDTILQKVYRTDSLEYYIAINGGTFFQNDSSIIAAGAFYNHHNGVDAMIIKFKLNGDTVWIKTYGDTAFYENIESCIQLPNGDIYAVGECDSNNATYAQYYLLKFDSNGNLKWTKNWGRGGWGHYLLNIAQAADGNLILGGQYYEWDVHASNYLARSTVHKVDTGGNIIWYNEYKKANDLFGTYIIPQKDSSIICLSEHDTTTYNPNPLRLGLNWFAKIDKNGNKKWDFTQIAYVYNHFASPPILLPNGGFVMCSSTVDTSKANGNQIGAISKYDKNCNEKWFRPIWHNPTDFGFFYAGAVATDGSIFAAGSAANFDSPPKQEMWLVHVDSMGCLVGGCDTIKDIGIGISSFPTNHSPLSLYPNPANQSIVISQQSLVNTIEVTNVLGQKMKATITPLSTYDLRLTTDDYPSGIYFLKVTDEKGFQQVAKFIKE